MTLRERLEAARADLDSQCGKQYRAINAYAHGFGSRAEVAAAEREYQFALLDYEQAVEDAALARVAA